MAKTRGFSSSSIKLSPLRMSEEDDADFLPPDASPEAKLKFEMNKRVRLGRSRDQDGKSNIWSIEPTMEVEEVSQ